MSIFEKMSWGLLAAMKDHADLYNCCNYYLILFEAADMNIIMCLALYHKMKGGKLIWLSSKLLAHPKVYDWLHS